MTAETVQRLLDATQPAAVRLARAVSLASRVEPELLRRARLELFPDLDVSAEADVWFSRLVASRSTRWLVFRPDVARELRLTLAGDPELLKKSWNIVQTAHARAAPAICIEEEVTYLALAGGDGAEDAIERILGGVLHAITVGERSGLLDWAARAIPALPERARRSESAAALSALISRTSVSGTMPRLLNNPGIAAAVAKKLPPTDLWLRLIDNGPEMRLDVSRTELAGGKAIQVPATDPVVLELTIGNDRALLSMPAGARPHSSSVLPTEEAFLRTLTGVVYRIARDWVWKEHKAVLVAGPATKLSPWLRRISHATGKMLAEEGYLLITAGGAGVEQLAAEGFASVAAKSAGPRMRHYVAPKRKPAVTLGKIIRTKSDQSLVRNAVAHAAAVIIFEGGPRTEMLGAEAVDQLIKLIPVGSTGAAENLRESGDEEWWDYEAYEALRYSGGNVEKQVELIREAIAKLPSPRIVGVNVAPDGEEYAR